jgi:hypothetical protein
MVFNRTLFWCICHLEVLTSLHVPAESLNGLPDLLQLSLAYGNALLQQNVDQVSLSHLQPVFYSTTGHSPAKRLLYLGYNYLYP